jgi:hypothetical protein
MAKVGPGKSDDEEFPKPAWPPIQDLDSVDIAAKRRDGGVDLFIVASQPLDASPETLKSIRQKVNTYLETIELEEFLSEMGWPARESITIVLTCEYPIHPQALAVIEECRLLAARRGVRLELRR